MVSNEVSLEKREIFHKYGQKPGARGCEAEYSEEVSVRACLWLRCICGPSLNSLLPGDTLSWGDSCCCFCSWRDNTPYPPTPSLCFSKIPSPALAPGRCCLFLILQAYPSSLYLSASSCWSRDPSPSVHFHSSLELYLPHAEVIGEVANDSPPYKMLSVSGLDQVIFI